MRIALLTLEATANARAVRRFVAAHAADIVLVGLSDPFRREAGGSLGQTWRRVSQSGPGILRYLTMNFALPRWVGASFKRDAGTEVDGTPLALACRARGIRALDVADVNGPVFREALATSGADLLVTFHFDQILSAATIGAVASGGINVHPSLLPAHRGPVPTLHALIDDPVRLGVSVHRLAPKIDAGALLAQVEVPDDTGLTALGAAARLHLAALPLLDGVLRDLAAGTAAETPLPVLPYRGFPTRGQLRRLGERGRSAAGPSDLREARNAAAITVAAAERRT